MSLCKHSQITEATACDFCKCHFANIRKSPGQPLAISANVTLQTFANHQGNRLRFLQMSLCKHSQITRATPAVYYTGRNGKQLN
jgi:hypothetical protein